MEKDCQCNNRANLLPCKNEIIPCCPGSFILSIRSSISRSHPMAINGDIAVPPPPLPPPPLRQRGRTDKNGNGEKEGREGRSNERGSEKRTDKPRGKRGPETFLVQCAFLPGVESLVLSCYYAIEALDIFLFFPCGGRTIMSRANCEFPQQRDKRTYTQLP